MDYSINERNQYSIININTNSVFINVFMTDYVLVKTDVQWRNRHPQLRKNYFISRAKHIWLIYRFSQA